MDHDDKREYDPYGEHYSVPDPHLASGGEAVGERGTYPGGESVRARTCESCGTTLSDVQGRSKCRHCLAQGIDPLDADADPTPGRAVEWQFQQVQFAVVPGETKYIAAARGATALEQAVDRTRAVDRVTPVYDFGEDVADVVADRWGGDLPDVTRLDSEQGQRLVGIVRADHDAGDPPRARSEIPFFVDATGAAIDVDADLAAAAIAADPVVDGADAPPVWLMPAWTLRRQGARPGGTVRSEIVTERECERCGHFTGHEFVDLLTVPAPYHSAGIWECSICRARSLGRGEHTGQPRAALRGDRSGQSRDLITRKRRPVDGANDEDADWERAFPLGEIVDPEVRPDP